MRTHAYLIFLLLSLSLVACSKDQVATAAPDATLDVETVEVSDGGTDVGPSELPTTPEGLPDRFTVQVLVTLDDLPVEGAALIQGGRPEMVLTDAQGRAPFEVDSLVPGDIFLMASHQDARIRGVEFYTFADPPEEVTIQLTRFERSDNLDYIFQDPGTPEDRDNTSQCGHCHRTTNDDWYGSRHRTSASNPTLQDLYAGAAHQWADEAACVARGGRWLPGLEPGTGLPQERCYLGEGVLPTLNSGCGGEGEESCDADATSFGDCADCHAPGINGSLGGRDLLEAAERAYDYGVHCDVCHRVESVNLEEEPGVAGRLGLVRPTEKPISISLGAWAPLTFGPSHDSPNPRMGSVQRDRFQSATFCAGCHQHDQRVMVPGVEIDTERWPSERLPIHSTFAEWEDGPMNPAAPCQSCHMPPLATAQNHGDMQIFQSASVGIVAGWPRNAGSFRRHTWPGPRDSASGMLESAVALFVEKSLEGGALVARVTTQNVGPGHAIPTGEPMRSMVLVVRAHCGEEALTATGGDAVPDFGGYEDQQDASGDWSHWPGAKVGDRIRVISKGLSYHDYPGVGRFGGGGEDAWGAPFTPEEKGMAREEVLGEREVISVSDGQVELSGPLPEGDQAYRVGPSLWPEEGLVASPWAGAPGFAFARVLVGAEGERMVPHFRAVDVASDNRLMPQVGWTSEHHFSSPCEDPVVEAKLLYRAYPLKQARQRGWSLAERVMAEVRR